MVELLLSAAATAAPHEAAEASAWGFDPGGWVALAMVAVIALMLRLKVPALIAGMLDKQIGTIRGQLDAASALRKEAEALKAEYEAKIHASVGEAEALKAAASREADEIVKQAKASATALIARRQKMAEDKIAAAERAAIADLRAGAAKAAAAAASSIIAKDHTAKVDKALVDEAIAGI
ncbi:MAG TPA: F0F1 ATP synthase subunit B [Novosphingobium sp.]|nr:F0F1 ATP synthase subunit B [Novosphingobium sp.]